mmetsp:Transcript_108588/g.242185  ORF Transcript_108588/g.242185 Transcript_108588/m.242185 type:complete len:192 (+) Transcript_108588:46-621(+)
MSASAARRPRRSWGFLTLGSLAVACAFLLSPLLPPQCPSCWLPAVHPLAVTTKAARSAAKTARSATGTDGEDAKTVPPEDAFARLERVLAEAETSGSSESTSVATKTPTKEQARRASEAVNLLLGGSTQEGEVVEDSSLVRFVETRLDPTVELGSVPLRRVSPGPYLEPPVPAREIWSETGALAVVIRRPG